jgi:hypothetical protein
MCVCVCVYVCVCERERERLPFPVSPATVGATVGTVFISGNLPPEDTVIVTHGTEPTELLSSSVEQDSA